MVYNIMHCTMHYALYNESVNGVLSMSMQLCYIIEKATTQMQSKILFLNLFILFEQ